MSDYDPKSFSDIEKYVQNQSDIERLFENIYQKIIKDDTSPELWIAIFVLQFANLENYLKRIISNVISQAMSDKNIGFNNSNNDELTFGQTIGVFEDLFIKGKFLLKGNNPKMKYAINFNLQKQQPTNPGVSKIFEKTYLIKYAARLKKLNKFRNNLYHNLFAYHEEMNINDIIESIRQLIDFDFIPSGTYNDYEFDEEYYDKIKNLKGFSKTVELKRKSLLSKNGDFPPERYASINMMLRIMFYHYSFTLMSLKKDINY